MSYEQGCLFCGKWLSVPDNYSGIVYCSVCGKDGKNRKREYVEKR